MTHTWLEDGLSIYMGIGYEVPQLRNELISVAYFLEFSLHIY